VGLAALALAVIRAPERAAGTRVAGALGASLGGLRIAVVNALFLRAESLRARARVEEATSLYATILELDPGNDAAFDHLAAVYAFDVLPEAVDAGERLSWWREAWDVVERGLALRPRSARLLVRSFDLLRLAATDADLAEPVATWLRRDPMFLAFERLLEAARVAEQVPKKGTHHLTWLAVWTPQVAAERLADGEPGVERFVAIGREALRLRGSLLAQRRVPEEVVRTERDLGAYLREGLDVVEAVAGGRDGAAVDRHEAAWPASPLLPPLRRAVAR
jgi:hypothetical protein